MVEREYNEFIKEIEEFLEESEQFSKLGLRKLKKPLKKLGFFGHPGEERTQGVFGAVLATVYERNKGKQ